MKEKLNEAFAARFPRIPGTLTLSKIRNLKMLMIDFIVSLSIEPSTLALTFVYFEKLVFKLVVDKYNRKLVMAVCFTLAFKFNEAERNLSEDLRENLEKLLRISKKALFKNEFVVYAQLMFNLKVPRTQWKPHLRRIRSILATRDYAGFDSSSSSNSEDVLADDGSQTD